MIKEDVDVQAERLVQALDNLRDGETAVVALVALGARSIDPLRRFLLRGRPGPVYQPRRWAVQALGSLDAKEVLVEYLTSLPHIPDPQVRFAEEVVQNAAVREFVRWPDAETTAFLLDLSRKKKLVGLAEVFGKLRQVEAIPYLDRALEDDCIRQSAEEALIAIGEQAREALILSSTVKLPVNDVEIPSSLRRRQSVLRVLAKIGIRPQDWPKLSPLIWERDPEIVVESCVLAVAAGILDNRETVAARLLAVSERAPWFLEEDIVECLLEWFEAAQPAIEAEIDHLKKLPETDWIRNERLRLLLRVKGRAQPRTPAI